MGYALVVVGILTAVCGLINGFGVNPASAPQQAVQRIDFAIGILGLILAGVGYIAAHAKMMLSVMQDRPASPKVAESPPEATQPAK